MVGHTHEDVGKTWSAFLALVTRRHTFQTPEELVAQTQFAMASVFAERDEEATASLLGLVFDFREWLDAEGIH